MWKSPKIKNLYFLRDILNFTILANISRQSAFSARPDNKLGADRNEFYVNAEVIVINEKESE